MNKQTFIKDLLAGLTVSFAALSLGAAFGTLSGRGAFAGMIGAAIIPIITSLFGGTRLQASGPTAPMTAISALLVAGAYESFPDKVHAEQFITFTMLLFGLLMIISGLLRFGKLIQYVPNAVTLGFMNGIALLIWVDQVSKIFGIHHMHQIEGSLWINIAVASITLVLIFLLPSIIKAIGIHEKYHSYISAMLLAIIASTIGANMLDLKIERVALGASVDSFGQYWGMIKSYFPDQTMLTRENFNLALPFALQLTLLGYLDSLLTSLVIDRMTNEKTKRNKELVAQGVANGLSGLFLGIPGAQATIRSVLLIKEQAQTRLAGVILGLFVLICIIFLKDYIMLIPAAVFTGVLLKAGWDVLDREYTQAYFERGWMHSINRNFQMFLILYTTVVTVLFDLNIAVVTATLLFYLARYIFKSFNLTDVEDNLADNIEDDWFPEAGELKQ